MRHFLKFFVLFSVFLSLQIIAACLFYPDTLNAERIENSLIIGSLAISLLFVLLNYFSEKGSIDKEDAFNKHGFLYLETSRTILQLKSAILKTKEFRDIQQSQDALIIRSNSNSLASAGAIIQIKLLNQHQNKQAFLITIKDKIPTTIVDFGYKRKVIRQLLALIKSEDAAVFYQFV